MLSDIRQEQKDKYLMILLTYKSTKINPTGIDRTMMVTRGWED
jgi:hypothetical protein